MASKKFNINPITHSLHKSVYLLDRVTAKALHERMGLTFSQFRVLLVVAHKPGTSQSDIASYHGLSRAAITRQIEILKAHSYITIQHNARNRREHTLKVTAKGEDCLHQAVKLINNQLKNVFSSFSREEKKSLENTLEKLVENLSNCKHC